MLTLKYLNVFVQEQLESGGETNSNYTKVGVAFLHDKGEGFNLRFTPGISVSGGLVAFLPKDKEKDIRWASPENSGLIPRVFIFYQKSRKASPGWNISILPISSLLLLSEIRS